MYPYVGVDVLLFSSPNEFDLFRRINLVNKTRLNVSGEDSEYGRFEENTDYQIEELNNKSVYYIVWYEEQTDKLVSGVLDFELMVAYISVYRRYDSVLENMHKKSIRVDKRMHEKSVKYSNIV